MARVQIIREVGEDFGNSGGWTLWLQWCLYVYDDSTSENGYRFIGRRPTTEGEKLKAARRQARISSLAIAKSLMERAEQEGLGALDG